MKVLELQATLMTAVAVDIIAPFEIDSSDDADAIDRFVNAVGPPYAGARNRSRG
jgi:hypothetical protein